MKSEPSLNDRDRNSTSDLSPTWSASIADTKSPSNAYACESVIEPVISSQPVPFFKTAPKGFAAGKLACFSTSDDLVQFTKVASLEPKHGITRFSGDSTDKKPHQSFR